MSDSKKTPETHPEELFADQAEELAARLGGDQTPGGPAEAADGDAWPETKSIGKAYGVQSILKVVIDQEPGSVDDGDHKDISKLVEDFEAAPPKKFLTHWEKYCTNPFVVVGVNWIAKVDEHNVLYWLQSNHLEEMEDKFPSNDPRKVEVANLEITFTHRSRATASYQVTEEFKNGKVETANSTAMLYKLADRGWRIAVVTKSTRYTHEVAEMEAAEEALKKSGAIVDES